MSKSPHREILRTARIVGMSLLATIFLGMIGAFTVSKGIDINLSADVAAVSEAMLEAEQRLQAKAYLGLLLFILQMVFLSGLFILLRGYGAVLALTSLFVGVAAAILGLLGAVFAMNAAQFAGNAAYVEMVNGQQRGMLAALQATSDYTSFHLGLVLSSLSNAGFFVLLLSSGLISRLISGWGIFASFFVALTIVARDFIPILGNNAITMAFMLSNLVALIATGLYLTIGGVRQRNAITS